MKLYLIIFISVTVGFWSAKIFALPSQAQVNNLQEQLDRKEHLLNGFYAQPKPWVKFHLLGRTADGKQHIIGILHSYNMPVSIEEDAFFKFRDSSAFFYEVQTNW